MQLLNKLKRGLSSLRLLINWTIKMAKKVRCLNSTTGGKSWEDMPIIPSGTATVGKLFYFSGMPASSTLSIYNTDLGLDASVDLTTIPILCQLRSNNIAFYIDKVIGNTYTHKIYTNRIVFDGLSTSYDYIATIAINTDAIADVSGGSSPAGTENQTLRYNATNELESTDRLQVFANQNVRINSIFSGSVYDTHLSILENNESESFNEVVLSIGQYGNIWNWALNNHDGEILYSNAGTIAGSGKLISDVRRHIEFTSEPLTVISDGYSFTNAQLGLTGINLNDKVKMAQCYVIQSDYPNVKNNELVMGHNIEDGQISVRLNFNLAVGDRIKIYLEYID